MAFYGTRLWGGRFSATTAEIVERLNNSLPFDSRLWRQDIRGSIAHAHMLGRTGILAEIDAVALAAELAAIETGLADGSLQLDPSAEDIHTAVEMLLRDRLGPLAGKLHTARSRNDQVATDTRLFVRDAVDATIAQLRDLQSALLGQAEVHLDTVLPGFTHLQHAQPILLAHHLMAYFWMLDRDAGRLVDGRRRTNVLPLGAGALAGTTYPADPHQVATELGFDEVFENSLDAVSDRDFIVEYLAAASLVMVHCSRLAEDLILWSCQEFGFVQLDDQVTTGSSIMPQKKNPDAAELARGKSGRVFGDLMSLLTVLKGLPLTYNKDLQEDKEALFDAVDTLGVVLPALTLTIATARFDATRMAGSVEGDFSTATDLADALVRTGMPFRQAHSVVGLVVNECIRTGRRLEGLTPADLRSMSPDIPDGLEVDLTPMASVNARATHGGTARTAVERQIATGRDRLRG